jgi:hypothetical protein
LKTVLPLGRYVLFFSAILIGLWISLAGFMTITSLFSNKSNIINHYFSSAFCWLSAMQALDYFYKENLRKPNRVEYWILVTSSTIITISIQNILWIYDIKPIQSYDRIMISLLIFGTAALGYADVPLFRYRNRKPD